MKSADPSVRLASIWAQDHGRVLGSGEGMLWRVPADSRFFKESTLGAPVIMGRSSWEALDGPLPGRENIVVTRNPNYVAAGATVVHDLTEAISTGQRVARDTGADTVWITGGAKIYEQTMGTVDELVVTQLDLTVPEGTSPVVLAPRIDPEVWRADPARSDSDWRPKSGDARWKVTTYVRR